jgi:hypothetical protein
MQAPAKLLLHLCELGPELLGEKQRGETTWCLLGGAEKILDRNLKGLQLALRSRRNGSAVGRRGSAAA